MASRNSQEVLATPILWSYSTNSAGKHPVKIRINHRDRRKYYSIVLSNGEKLFLDKGEYASIVTSELRTLRRNKREIRETVDLAKDRAKSVIEKVTSRGKSRFSFSAFEKEYLGTGAGTFLHSFREHIEALSSKGQVGTARTYKSAYSALNRFLKGKEIDPSDLTPAKLESFESWLRSEQATTKQRIIREKNSTSISIYMRCIRAVYNRLANADSYLKTVYPFSQSDHDNGYRIPSSSGSKGSALSRDQLKLFRDGIVSGPVDRKNPMYRAKMLFLFSFLAQGANFKDMALMKYENIKGQILEFERHKTQRTKRSERTIKVPMSEFLVSIIDSIGNPNQSPQQYIFEVFDPIKKYTEGEKDDTVRQFIKTTNKWLGRYCLLIGLPPISTYWSRHSFAGLAKKVVPVVMIKEMLGHSRISTTETYLGRFSDDEMEEGYKRITNELTLAL
jgi:integrase